MYPKAPESVGKALNRYVVKKGGEGEAEMESESPVGMLKSSTAFEVDVRYMYEF